MSAVTRKSNNGSAIVLIAYQALTVLAMPFYFWYATPSLAMTFLSIALLYLTGLSITGAYHRYYSHKAYRLNPVAEAVLLFFGSMAGQGSALRWSYDHRLHHAYVDTDKDPYSIKKGFWYAHFLWLLDEPQPIDGRVVPDLMKNRMVTFQHRHIVLCIVASNVLAFLAVGWLLNDFLGAAILAVWIRLFTLHHFTWFINSLAHSWGDKPFSQELTAVDNYFLSVLTFGEGYHNYHHTFANDYRNGIRWYHFDPTKWLIWTLSKLGLAYDLKRVDPYTIHRKMLLEQKSLLLERCANFWNAKKDELEKQINDLSEGLIHQLSILTQLQDRYREFLNANTGREVIRGLQQEISIISQDFRANWKLWQELSKNILKGNLISDGPCCIIHH